MFYYVAGNTAEGFVNFLDSNVDTIDHVITLNHPSNPLKTEVMRKVIEHFESDYNMEVIKSIYGGNFLDGVVIRERSLAIISDTILTDTISSQIIDLEQVVLLQVEGNVREEEKQIQSHTNSAYKSFAKGLEVHDELEAIFINEMDFQKADAITEKFIIDLLYQAEPKDRQVTKRHRLFGTNTPDGAVNIVQSLLDDLDNCYFLKGRAGTGKSTFMRKVVKACESHGYDMEIYHCSFDPKSIDMVVVRELDFCIFDSTDPHEFFPDRSGDHLIDLYESTVTSGTDEKYATDIQRITNKYKSYMRKGLNDLKEARRHQYEQEKKYSFNDEVLQEIFNKIIKTST